MNREETKQPLESLVIEHSAYKTVLTKKFKNRKQYQENDPRKITAFIPGTVVDIFVKKGARVKKGEPLLILEAMKMRNHLNAPMDGKIKTILIQKNTIVSKNKLLIEME